MTVHAVEMHDLTCGECGVPFCLPESKMRDLKRTHEIFYCPNGHPRCFPGKTDQEKKIEELERQLRSLQDTIERVSDREADVHETVRHLADVVKACPVEGCEWHTTRRLASYPEDYELGRFVERVHGDLREHLRVVHGAHPARKLLEAGAPA